MPIYVSKGGGGGGADADAIHDNVAGEIAAIAEKTAPVAADMLLIEDSAAANVKKMLQLSNFSLDMSCRAVLGSDQSIPNSTTTTVTNWTETWDTDAFHNDASNPERFYAPVDGLYLIIFGVTWASNNTGIRVIWNVSAAGVGVTQTQKNAAGGAEAMCATIISMSAGDYAYSDVFQSSGGALSLITTSFGCSFTIIKLANT